MWYSRRRHCYKRFFPLQGLAGRQADTLRGPADGSQHRTAVQPTPAADRCSARPQLLLTAACLPLAACSLQGIEHLSLGAVQNGVILLCGLFFYGGRFFVQGCRARCAALRGLRGGRRLVWGCKGRALDGAARGVPARAGLMSSARERGGWHPVPVAVACTWPRVRRPSLPASALLKHTPCHLPAPCLHPRHFLGVWHARDGVGGQELRGAHQTAVPPRRTGRPGCVETGGRGCRHMCTCMRLRVLAMDNQQSAPLPPDVPAHPPAPGLPAAQWTASVSSRCWAWATSSSPASLWPSCCDTTWRTAAATSAGGGRGRMPCQKGRPRVGAHAWMHGQCARACLRASRQPLSCSSLHQPSCLPPPCPLPSLLQRLCRLRRRPGRHNCGDECVQGRPTRAAVHRARCAAGHVCARRWGITKHTLCLVRLPLLGLVSV